jgi:hypothetical protein
MWRRWRGDADRERLDRGQIFRDRQAIGHEALDVQHRGAPERRHDGRSSDASARRGCLSSGFASRLDDILRRQPTVLLGAEIQPNYLPPISPIDSGLYDKSRETEYLRGRSLVFLSTLPSLPATMRCVEKAASAGLIKQCSLAGTGVAIETCAVI